ncbi:hypothetical protein C3747_2g136 [Trypanosoma cruzi]|uniref:Uncharacterized protein n=1 Tax=Trypanosoma cruzi TaxID=5693 RepID=A0A2V2XL32_TRYCR|nr:hypothetical protein C3747_2g136 [Trypanosoma cruzi]
MKANTGKTKRGLLLTGGAALLHLKYDGAPVAMERMPVLLGVNSWNSRGMSAHAGKLREESKRRLPRLTAIWSLARGNQRHFGSVPPRAGVGWRPRTAPGRPLDAPLCAGFRTLKGERNSRANPEERRNGGRRVGSAAAAPPRYSAGARLPVCVPMRDTWWRLAAWRPHRQPPAARRLKPTRLHHGPALRKEACCPPAAPRSAQVQLFFGPPRRSKNEACDAKARKASELTRPTDTCIAGVVATVKRIICARPLNSEACRTAVTGREPTRTDSALARGEEAALARLCAGVPHKHGWPPRPPQPVTPGKCRCCGPDAHSRHAKNLARKLLPLGSAPPRSGARKAARCAEGVAAAALVSWREWLTPVALRGSRRCGKPTSSGKPKTPGTPFKPPPATLAGTRARDGTTIAPPPWAAQPRPKPFPAFSARRRANRKADSVFIVTTSAIRAVPRQVGSVPVNMAIWLCPPRSNAFPVDPRTKRKRDYHPK